MRVRGGLVVRIGVLVLGLLLFAAGVVALLESHLGLSPWDVLHQGIEKHSPLSFGEANVVVGITVLFLARALGVPPGFGTIANGVLVGTFIDLLTRVAWIDGLAGDPLLVRSALIPVGIGLIGIATALYIGSALGAGPRDSLMLAGVKRLGVRVGIVRAGIEGTALLCGIALKGTFGVGTVAFALLVGPTVELSFGLLRRSPFAARPVGPRA